MTEVKKTEQIDNLTTVSHLGKGHGDVLCDYNKYVIKETGHVFYEETESIREAYYKHCETVTKVNINGATVEMIGSVTRRPTFTWLPNPIIGCGCTVPIQSITLYNYVVLSTLEYFVSESRNIHIAYRDFLKKKKQLQAAEGAKCCIC